MFRQEPKSNRKRKKSMFRKEKASSLRKRDTLQRKKLKRNLKYRETNKSRGLRLSKGCSIDREIKMKLPKAEEGRAIRRLTKASIINQRNMNIMRTLKGATPTKIKNLLAKRDTNDKVHIL